MIANISPFADFDTAAQQVLAFLYQRCGLSLWMVNRSKGENGIVLQVEDHGYGKQYGIQQGSLFCWLDSFCSRMVRGEGPCVAPKANSVPAYMEAPLGQQLSVNAYVGVPILLSDGSLFGSLCGLDPNPQPDTIHEELPTIELLTQLLATILENELIRNEQLRDMERMEAEAMSDPLTNLYNRRAWEKLLSSEEKRCQQYGNPAGVIYIDLDNLKFVNDTQGHTAGYRLIKQASQTIYYTVRKQDIVARLGGDEFAVLGVECNQQQIQHLAQRIQRALDSANISACVGYASRHPQKGLVVACEEADHNMYRRKHHKRGDHQSSQSASSKQSS